MRLLRRTGRAVNLDDLNDLGVEDAGIKVYKVGVWFVINVVT